MKKSIKETEWFSKRIQCSIRSLRTIQLTFFFLMVSGYQLIAGVTTVKYDIKFVSQQQEKKISGKITDLSGAPLPGATVLVVGTTIGTLTDGEGNFTLSIPIGAKTLSVSYIGMNPQQVTLSNQSVYNLKLEQSQVDLGEIVVIGYGTAQKRDLTGSVSSIDPATLKNLPSATIDQKLIGQTAGVQIKQISGTPGGGTSVKIRGTGSLTAGNEPLYVVDGIPYSTDLDFFLNPLVYLNPNDIESISILKDASSTAIYGSRGANGVIIITTKKGNLGKTEINFSLMRGVQTVPENGRPKVFNAEEFAEYMQDQIKKRVALENREVTPDDIPLEYRNPESLGAGYDHYGLLLHPAPIMEVNLSLSKGTQESKINFTLGYFNQEGVIKYTGLERYTGKLTMESNIAKVIKVGASLQPTFVKQKRTDSNRYRTDIIGFSLVANPTVSPYDADGNLVQFLKSPTNKYSGAWSFPNPVFALRETIGTQNDFRNLGSVYVEWEIIPNLIAKSNLSTIWTQSDFNKYSPSTVGGNNRAPVPGTGFSNRTRLNSFNWLLENTLTYGKVMGNHSINAILGYTLQENTIRGITLQANPYSNDLIETINAAQAIKTWGEEYGQWAIISYLGRINYAYKEKYLLTATFRSDGSSRFGSENRYANFPSFAAAWRVSGEEFMKDIKIINDLKLRLSFGTSGNNNIGNYRSLSSIIAGQYLFGTTQVSTAAIGISNPLLTWEESQTLDVGLDLGMFNNRLYLTVDYYNRKSYNMLLDDLIPAITGFNSQTVNRGSIRNSGVEIELDGTPLAGAFKWDVSLNLAFNRNKVLSLNDKGDRILSGSNGGFPTHVTYIGKPMTQFFGFALEGLLTAEDIANPDLPKDNIAHEGGNKYTDINGDGVISDILDYTIIGNPWPDCIYGISNNFSYKNFSLSVYMNGQVGGEVMDYMRQGTSFLWGKTNLSKEWLNRWISPEQPGDGMHSGVCTGSENWTWKVNSLWVEDATFLRISNVSFSYTIPNHWLDKSKIVKNCNLYFMIQNLATFTNYSGANPESLSVTLDPGWDCSSYPLARISSLGVNLSF
jgi:TonB-linked SusC/RagA family outer membrane protein